MSRRKATTPIPPLSFDALQKVQEMETYATRALQQCDSGMGFNKQKAIRIMRTCVVDVVDSQIDYYLTLPTYDERWIKEIVQNAISSTIGLSTSHVLNYSNTFDELGNTVMAHLAERRQNNTLNSTHQASTIDGSEAIGQQIQRLLEKSRLTVEQLAESAEIATRTVYRHLSNDAEPRISVIEKYEKVFTKRIGSPIRIEVPSKSHASVTSQPGVIKKSGKRHA